MVSIPDWSRWGRLQIDGNQGNNKTSAESLLAKYDRNRELEAIRMAEDSGYFLNVNAAVILSQHKEQVSDKEEIFKDIKKVKYLRFHNSHLRSLGSIDFCVRLKILCLSSNFITNIDGLSGLKHLIKLDLSSNQLQTLPGMAFWAGLRKLQILHLHDNPIGKTDSVYGLNGCRQLSILTLYDTPLSLKRNYRHHIVNSIWSLRVLDYFVVSDEEIIEDASFPGPKFKAFDDALRINPYPSSKSFNYSAEYQQVLQLNGIVSAIQAHFSPVLIIQRFIRGHLTRRRFNVVSHHRQWAAKTVQRWWRSHAPGDGGGDDLGSDDLGRSASVAAAMAVVAGVPTSGRETEEVSVRPPSQAQSEGASTVVKGPTSDVELLPEHSPVRMMRSQMSSAATMKSRAPIFINLNQLDTGGKLPQLDSAAAALESQQPFESDDKPSVGKHSARTATRKSLRTPQKVPVTPGELGKSASASSKRIRDIKQFFGPMVPVVDMTPEPTPRESDTEIPLTAFRSPSFIRELIPPQPPKRPPPRFLPPIYELRGLPPEVLKLDPITELIIQRTEAAKMIREAEHEFHQQRIMEPPPLRPPRHLTKNNDQRLFGRVQGTMGLMLLQKWDRIDRDVQTQERQVAQMEAVMATRDARNQAKENLRLWKAEKRNKARQVRQKTWRDSNRQIERGKLATVQENGRYQWRRDREKQMRRTFGEENRFAQDFTTQHNSVSKALLRHDRQALSEDRQQAKMETVTAHRGSEKEQMSTVQKYLDHQRMMRQAEIAVQRAAVNSKILVETNDRLLNAHARVDRLKALRRQAIEFSTSKHNYPEIDPLMMEELKSANRFEVQAAIHGGRVGLHPSA